MIIPGFIISCATFPGVIVHELGHVAFCKFTKTPVRDVCYFRLGNPAGYVIHDRPISVWRHILIGIGPLFVNTFLGFLIGLIAALSHLNIDRQPILGMIVWWLAVSIAMHSFPSVGDAKSIWKAIWSEGAPVTARILGSPLVVLIFVGAIGSIFWLDLAYGVGIVFGIPKLLSI